LNLHAPTREIAPAPTGKRKKSSQPEFRLQVALADLLRRAANPRIFWTAIDHGEERKRVLLPNGKWFCPAADRAERKGVKNGLPDFWFILAGGLSAGLELKAGKGKPSPAQEAMRDAWKAAGALYEFATGWDEAINFFNRWGIVKASPFIPAKGRE
jgi:hypothetical protein